MKSKKILLPLIFAAFSLSGCNIRNSKPRIIHDNTDNHSNIEWGGYEPTPNPDPRPVVEPKSEKLELLERYQPESLRGFDNLAQFVFNAYGARQFALSNGTTYVETIENYSDGGLFEFSLDTDGDGDTEVVGYPVSEEKSYRFENFAFFDFDVDECDFIQDTVGLGRIHAVIVETDIFGETFLALKNGTNYYACARTVQSSRYCSFSTYKYLDHFFICKDSNIDYEFKVTFDENYGNHSKVTKISFEDWEFDVVENSTKIYKECIYSIPEEQMDYLNNYSDPNSRMPKRFLQFRLPEYVNDSCSYYYFDYPSGYDSKEESILYIQNIDEEGVEEYKDLLDNSAFTSKFNYRDEIVYVKPYDRNYDLYLFVNGQYDLTIRVFLVPYVNQKTAFELEAFPTIVNNVTIPVSYNTKYGTFVLKEMDGYECVFVFNSSESELANFYNQLCDAGFEENTEKKNVLIAKLSNGTYEIDANNLEVVPYYYITVKKVR